MSPVGPLAEAKAIGEDVADLVVDAVAGLEAAANPETYYDAHAAAVTGPRTTSDVAFGGISLIHHGNLSHKWGLELTAQLPYARSQ